MPLLGKCLFLPESSMNTYKTHTGLRKKHSFLPLKASKKCTPVCGKGLNFPQTGVYFQSAWILPQTGVLFRNKGQKPRFLTHKAVFFLRPVSFSFSGNFSRFFVTPVCGKIKHTPVCGKYLGGFTADRCVLSGECHEMSHRFEENDSKWRHLPKTHTGLRKILLHLWKTCTGLRKITRFFRKPVWYVHTSLRKKNTHRSAEKPPNFFPQTGVNTYY